MPRRRSCCGTGRSAEKIATFKRNEAEIWSLALHRPRRSLRRREPAIRKSRCGIRRRRQRSGSGDRRTRERRRRRSPTPSSARRPASRVWRCRQNRQALEPRHARPHPHLSGHRKPISSPLGLLAERQACWRPQASTAASACGRYDRAVCCGASTAIAAASVAFRSRPTARRIASGGADGQLRIWDVEPWSHAAHASPATHGAVNGVTFAPDGEQAWLPRARTAWCASGPIPSPARRHQLNVLTKHRNRRPRRTRRRGHFKTIQTKFCTVGITPWTRRPRSRRCAP